MQFGATCGRGRARKHSSPPPSSLQHVKPAVLVHCTEYSAFFSSALRRREATLIADFNPFSPKLLLRGTASLPPPSFQDLDAKKQEQKAREQQSN